MRSGRGTSRFIGFNWPLRQRSQERTLDAVQEGQSRPPRYAIRGCGLSELATPRIFIRRTKGCRPPLALLRKTREQARCIASSPAKEMPFGSVDNAGKALKVRGSGPLEGFRSPGPTASMSPPRLALKA